MLRIIFAGTPELSSNIFQALLHAKQHKVIACLTQPDKPAGRGRKLTPSPVKQQALEHSISVYQPETLKSKDIQVLIETLAPDIIVVVAYGLILPEYLLSLPQYGCINVHMSLLPKWRGASPIQQAILAGDAYTGVTIMQMDASLDTGDILAVESFPITATDTSNTLQKKMADIGSQQLIKVLASIQAGTIQPNQQDHSQATYAHKINKLDAKINWQHAASLIDRQIRAFNPSPIAFTQAHNEIIRIWHAILPSNQDKGQALPGTIITANKHGIDVATIDGIISLQKIQLPGKKPLSITEILNSKHNLFIPGTILQ